MHIYIYIYIYAINKFRSIVKVLLLKKKIVYLKEWQNTLKLHIIIHLLVRAKKILYSGITAKLVIGLAVNFFKVFSNLASYSFSKSTYKHVNIYYKHSVLLIINVHIP